MSSTVSASETAIDVECAVLICCKARRTTTALTPTRLACVVGCHLMIISPPPPIALIVPPRSASILPRVAYPGLPPLPAP